MRNSTSLFLRIYIQNLCIKEGREGVNTGSNYQFMEVDLQVSKHEFIECAQEEEPVKEIETETAKEEPVPEVIKATLSITTTTTALTTTTAAATTSSSTVLTTNTSSSDTKVCESVTSSAVKIPVTSEVKVDDVTSHDRTKLSLKLPPRPEDYDFYWYQDDDGTWRNEYDDQVGNQFNPFFIY